MYSTADDIAKFAEAFIGGKLLKQPVLKQMFTSGLNEYGLGVCCSMCWKLLASLAV
jgi:D-alanyl-D-alanine carboxypeptidase